MDATAEADLIVNLETDCHSQLPHLIVDGFLLAALDVL